MRKKKTIGLCILLSSVQVWAQRSDTLQLVTIKTSRFTKFATGSSQYTIDSTLMLAYKAQHLAQLLAAESQIYMRTYGPGSLTSSSFRGASAEHTAVIWKGFNLQNPMYGQVDFTQIPTELTDRVTIQYGGNGALFGSGAIGGSIRLESTPTFGQPTRTKATLLAGSFGLQRYSVSCDWGKKQKRSKLLAYHEQARNNFTFTNTALPGSPEQRMQHATAQQSGVVLENVMQLRKKQIVSAALWYHQANRQLALPMSVTGVGGNQIDKSLKATIDWTKSHSDWLLMARTALFYDLLNYANPVDIFSGNSQSLTSITEVEGRYTLRAKHHFNVGINQTAIWAESDGYGGRFNQLRTAVFASYKTFAFNQKLQLSASVREELVSSTLTPIMPYIGIEYKLRWGLQLLANANRSYRLPTFNELFWRTAQNQTLLPESGWGGELGLTHSTPNTNKLRIESRLTYFERVIDNWIVWQPVSLGNGWAPKNLRQVHTKGTEFKIAGTFIATQSLQFTVQSQFSGLQSVVSKSNLNDDEAVGKQLIFVPRLTHQHRFVTHYKRSYIGYLHTYTGLRFTASDNSGWLNDYQLGSIIAGHKFHIRSISFVTQFQLNNCWNAAYTVMADRPMPGRNYLITFQFQL
ncbi:MAG: TonB-dependent receptor [Bacteroidia bacterium]|nr:TonB-dependent receptor [Bacteroidia bacterium]